MLFDNPKLFTILRLIFNTSFNIQCYLIPLYLGICKHKTLSFVIRIMNFSCNALAEVPIDIQNRELFFTKHWFHLALNLATFSPNLSTFWAKVNSSPLHLSSDMKWTVAIDYIRILL